ncbi:hypothetical protein [Candidatus Deianiraea vastatrix]|uniref:Uncharacterized protein n=1 Tax=Candidatus Deianiraea vastatrix TaxID=2163644 RepID=A0A5B8XCU5_9RICK|nr:hypothetical protein [Candidatus Deianiraea vastatrix]QED23060.1 hypothetical protein Deia_00252 [Candidatus Deianiraea vastatrix]
MTGIIKFVKQKTKPGDSNKRGGGRRDSRGYQGGDSRRSSENNAKSNLKSRIKKLIDDGKTLDEALDMISRPRADNFSNDRDSQHPRRNFGKRPRFEDKNGYNDRRRNYSKSPSEQEGNGDERRSFSKYPSSSSEDGNAGERRSFNPMQRRDGFKKRPFNREFDQRRKPFDKSANLIAELKQKIKILQDAQKSDKN